MNRNEAIAAENAAMDELARLSVELETLALLIVHHAQHPTVVRRLTAIRRRLQTLKANEIERREAAARFI